MTFNDLKTYFQANGDRFADLAWDDPHQLGPATLRAVRGSLQAYQRGAGTGGEHLLALVSQLGDADYAAATQLFVQEEASHTDLLGRFMDQQGIERRPAHWLATVFRTFGRALGLMHLVRFILLAEVVAIGYYRALYQATYSGLLQQLCRRILLDKEMHIVYHCLAVRQLATRRNWLSAWLGQQACRGLLVGLTPLSYLAARRTLRAGGYGLWRFCAAVAAEYSRVEQMQRPGALLALRGSPPAPAGPASPAGAWQWPSQQLRAAR